MYLGAFEAVQSQFEDFLNWVTLYIFNILWQHYFETELS